MTLIAVFPIIGVPVMISDILLSADYGFRDKKLPKIEIPTLGKVPFLVGKNNDKEFTGLIQKTITINNNCIIGWAGNLKNSFDCIEEISGNADISEWDFDTIYKWFAGITNAYNRKKQNQKPNFIAVNHDNSHKFKLLSSQIHQNFKLFDKVIAIGSGAKKFNEILEKIDKISEDHPFHPNSKIINRKDPHIKIISDSMFIVGEYLKEDFFASKQSLKNLFGGWFFVVGSG